MKVLIKKSKSTTYWYHKLIGEVVEVEEEKTIAGNYIAKNVELYSTIDVDDCTEVSGTYYRLDNAQLYSSNACGSSYYELKYRTSEGRISTTKTVYHPYNEEIQIVISKEDLEAKYA